MGNNIKKMYSTKETCDILKISKPTLFRYIKRGKLKPVRLSSRINRFDEGEICRLMIECGGSHEVNE
jgi:predicted site-specific integrase-resolvase